MRNALLLVLLVGCAHEEVRATRKRPENSLQNQKDEAGRLQDEARRLHCENAFWAVLNAGRVGAPNEVPKQFDNCPAEKQLGVAVKFLLDLNASDQARFSALSMLGGKGIIPLPQHTQLEIKALLTNPRTEPLDRLDALQSWMAGDLLASRFLNRVLNDDERMKCFLTGELVPLHEIPKN